MKRHDRSFWKRLTVEVREGATVAAVASRHRVREKTLRWWCWQLGRVEAEPDLRLVPVVTEAAHAAVRRQIEIALGSAALRVDEGTDVHYVASLARALRDAC